MNEMICYIFSNLKSSEYALKSIRKVLASQTRFNKAVTIFTVAAAINIVVLETQLKRQNQKMKKMAKKI